MGDLLFARFSLQSTQWLKDTVLSAGPLKEAPWVAGPFAYLLLSVLSPESPDKVRRSLTSRYLAALLAPAVMAGVMLVTWPFLRDEPDLPYLLAVIFCAWYGGLGPGLLSVLISLLLIDFFVTEPHSFFSSSKGVDLVRLLLFAGVGSFIGVMTELRHRERRRAEINLESAKRAQSRIESVLNSVADIHMLFDRDCHYLYVNEAAVRAVGRPREQILGRTLWEVYPDIVGTELDRQYRRAMEERLPVAFDFHYLTLDTWWENRFYPSPEGLSVFATNITERKRAEEQFRQSEETLRQLGESITEVFWMTNPDKQQVLYVSPGYEKIWGRTCESVYEQPTAWIDAIHPDDRHRVETSATTQQVLGTYDEEYRIIRPDGSVRWIRDRAFPIYDTSGRVYRVTGIAEDITDRRRATQSLRLFRALIDRSSDAIEVIDPNTLRFLDCNESAYEILGYLREEFLALSVYDIAPEIDERMVAWVNEEIDRSGFVMFEAIHQRKDGSTFPVEVNLTTARPERDYRLAVVRDITERKVAEEELRKTSEQLRALSARFQSAREEEGIRIAREIHDELGSMLTSLKWDLEEIDRTLSTPMKQSQLARLREKLGALMKLTDKSVSALRRIASELRPSVLDDLGLAAAIEWHTQQFQARTGIVCDCDCSLENFELSEEQSTAVFRIFQEALTNVLRHAQATKVDIEIKTEVDYFVLVVSDNGKGITEKEKAERQSLGILGMRERAHLIGAEIDIKGVERKGTMVTIRVPISGRGKVLKSGQSMQ